MGQARLEPNFHRVLKGLEDTRLSLSWRSILSTKTPTEWFESFSTYLVPELATLLDRDTAPSIEEIQALSWHDPQDAGVYACLMTSGTGENVRYHLYVGYAACAKGMDRRRKQHLPKVSPDDVENYFYQILHPKDGVPPLHSWHVLFRVPSHETMPVKEWQHFALLCHLAKGILQAWLQAYKYDAQSDLTSICPFTSLPWYGACSRTALRESALKGNTKVHLSDEDRKKALREYFADWRQNFTKNWTAENWEADREKGLEKCAKYRRKLKAKIGSVEFNSGRKNAYQLWQESSKRKSLAEEAKSIMPIQSFFKRSYQFKAISRPLRLRQVSPLKSPS